MLPLHTDGQLYSELPRIMNARLEDVISAQTFRSFQQRLNTIVVNRTCSALRIANPSVVGDIYSVCLLFRW